VEEKKQSNPFSGFFANAKKSYEDGSKPMNFFGLRNDDVVETKVESKKKDYLEKSIAEIKLEKIKRILIE